MVLWCRYRPVHWLLLHPDGSEPYIKTMVVDPFPSVVFQKCGGLGDCFLLSFDVVLDARPAYFPQAFASSWRDTNYLITLP